MQHITQTIYVNIGDKPLTFGSDARTCCFTSQTSRSDGNCRHLETFSSGTWIRTSSQPSRGSGGGSSSKPTACSMVIWSEMCVWVLFVKDACGIWRTMQPSELIAFLAGGSVTIKYLPQFGRRWSEVKWSHFDGATFEVMFWNLQIKSN